MRTRPIGRLSWGSVAAAMAVAHVRYWLTVAPQVHAELRRWNAHAVAIPDPVLRSQALRKLRDERPNTEVLATLTTLVPGEHRSAVVRASVALQVMYDYLDAITETDTEDRLLDGVQLHHAFATALGVEGGTDYYRHHPYRDDGGYLDALVERCRSGIVALPSSAAVMPVARRAAERFGESQTRSHAVPTLGAEQLQLWARSESGGSGMSWWEWAAGAAASVFAVHALLVAAADPHTTPEQAQQIDDAYLRCSALATMLDSVVDDDVDAREGNHRYIAYYPSADAAAQRIASLARSAVDAAHALRDPAHHVLTVSGIAAFYLSMPGTRTPARATVAHAVVDALRPVVILVLGTFRLWRWIKGRG